jgi:hypothetical protein
MKVPIMTLQLLHGDWCEKLAHIHSLKLFQRTDGIVKLKTLFNVQVYVSFPRIAPVEQSAPKTGILETVA